MLKRFPDDTRLDFDGESLAEIPPLSWDENDLAFAIELIEEADGIMGNVTVRMLSASTKLLTASGIISVAVRRIA
jgi:hypothetical protein